MPDPQGWELVRIAVAIAAMREAAGILADRRIAGDVEGMTETVEKRLLEIVPEAAHHLAAVQDVLRREFPRTMPTG